MFLSNRVIRNTCHLILFPINNNWMFILILFIERKFECYINNYIYLKSKKVSYPESRNRKRFRIKEN